MDGKPLIEGYLYTFGPSRYGGTFCHLIFCVLKGRHFSQYRGKDDKIPLRSGFLDSQLRLTDIGRQIVSGQTLYTIRLYNFSDTSKEVLLGTSSSEETALWIEAFKIPLNSKFELNFADALSRFPLSNSSSPKFSAAYSQSENVSFHFSSPNLFAKTTRVSSNTSLPTIHSEATPLLPKDAAPENSVSKWKLVRCRNGLRFFEEVSDNPIVHTFYKLPVTKCVGVVKAPPDLIFDLLMDYGPERSQWDSTIDSAEIIETNDGHSDIVYIKIRQDWIWLRSRELCVSRYWKRDENGTYSIFFKSVLHPKCPSKWGQIRATIHSGGYIISPLQDSSSGKPRSLVEHVLEMDVGGWSSWFGILLSPYPAFLRDGLLVSVAGIREYFAAQRMTFHNSVNLKTVSDADIASPFVSKAMHADMASINSVPFLDSTDFEEFFDAGNGEFDAYDSSVSTEAAISISVEPSNTSKKKQSIPDYLTGEWDSQSQKTKSSIDWSKVNGNIPFAESGRHCYSRPDPTLFAVRSKSFLIDGSRVPAGNPVCQLIAVDWMKNSERIDHVAKRPLNIVQKVKKMYPQQDPFFFLINLQVPGTNYLSLVYYFVCENKIPDDSLFFKFINGDDDFRNSRLTLIPSIPEGSWLVKQAVGSRPVPLGQIMEINYCTGANYIEVDINMASSSIVKGVLGLVIGYMSILVVDMAFLLRGDSEEELPEQLLGVARCSHIDLKLAKPPMPEN